MYGFMFGLHVLIFCQLTAGGEVQKLENSDNQSNDIDRSSHDHYVASASHHDEHSFQGYWKKKIIWQPRWVKSWQEKKIYVSVWKKIWTPAIVKEWVPVPKPPPGWDKQDTGKY